MHCAQQDLHVRKHPCAVLVVVGEERNARQTDALRDGLESRLFFGLVFGPCAALFGLRRWVELDGDGGRGHCCACCVWRSVKGKWRGPASAAYLYDLHNI
jgi:hypothetical protein